MAGNTLDTILNIKVEGTSQMVAFKDAIDKTAAELKTLKAEQKAAGADGAKYNKQIVESETKLKSMRKQLNLQKNDLIKTNSALSATGKSYNDLTKQNAALVVQMKKLQDPLGKDRKEFDKLTGTINRNTAALTKMDAKMGRSQRNVGNYGGAIKGMALQIGAAVMAFKTLERVIGVFVDFEFQIKQVGVISGATATEMKMLEEQAKDLGGTTAFTAGEVAALQKELAKLGFDPEDINNMTSSVLDLAFAFGDDLDQTATVVGATLRQFNLDAEETSRVTDVMAVAFANSSLDLGKFETAMSKAAPVAKALGFTLEDTTAILGTLVNAGLDASTAGTSLKNIFLKLADPTGDLAQALGRNIKSVDELVPAMNELVAKGVDVAGMLEITDKRSVTAFASMLAGSQSITEMSEKLKNAEGTTKAFAEVMRDTLKGSIDEMTSAASAFAMELIENLAPILETLIDLVGSMFSVLKKMSPVIVSLTAGFVAYKVVVMASNVASKAWAATQVLMRIAAVATSGGVTGLTRAIRLLNIAIKANPIGLLIGGLTAGIALLTTMSDESEESAEAMEKLNAETERMDAIKEGLKNTQAEELQNVRELIAKIKDENAERKDRLKAVKELNQIAGTNITNLKDEKKLADQLASAYKTAVAQIKAKYVLDLAKGKVLGLVQQELDLMNDLKKAQDAENLALKEYNAVKKENAAIHKNDKVAIANSVAMIDIEGQAVEHNIDIQKRSEERTKSNTLHEEFYQEQKQKRIDIEKKITDLQTKQNEKMSEAQKIVDGLVVKGKDDNDDKKEKITLYEQLRKNVTEEEKALKKLIIQKNNGKATDEQVEAQVKELKKAKKKLMDVDDQVKKKNKEIEESLKPVEDALTKQIKKINETIDAENKQLDAMKKLEDAGANLAKERIEQSLKIAQAELDLALITIQSSDETTKTQVDNINKLKSTITGYQNDLKDLGNDPDVQGGWMKKTLYGSTEDGTAFTGEDLVESISMTIGAVMDIMSSVNELQHTQMDAQIQGIEGEKETELKAIRETQKYKIASSEEQAKMEEDIAAKHDKKILDLKIKQFERDKKMMKSQALMAGAMAIMNIWAGTISGNPVVDAIIKGIMTAAMVAMTGLQIATINAQPPPTAELGGVMDESFFEEGGSVKKHARGGMVQGKSHAQGGEKFSVGGRVVELEGGEAVINKKSTAMFKPMLSQINQAGGGRKFADGGMISKFADGGMVMATDMMEQQSLAMSNALSARKDQKVFLVEADVTDTQIAVKNIEAQATF